MKTADRKNNFFRIAVLCVVLCAFLAGIGLSAVKADAAVEEKTIRIAHISDMHVMIEEYCNVYSGSYVAETKVTKLLEETPMIAEAVFEDLYNMNENAPMYVFITGDITSNGEYENHVWLSKLYKNFTKKMRERTDYDFSGFQIFLSPGNHDLYNCHAKSFMPSDEELNDCADDAARKALLESYEERSVPSITSKQFMDLYSDFGYCDCPDRKNGHHLATCGMVDGCSLEYFFESEYWYDDETSRDGTGLEVRTPSEKTIEAFEASDKDYNIYNPDGRFGACSYIARMGDFDVITFDSNTRAYKYEKWETEGDAAVRSCGGWHETTGGMVSEDQLRWAVSSVREDVAANKAVFALGHTNFLPHFDSEDEVISLFTYDNWEQASYTLADNGIRYVFSGHQHASDITSYVTQNGNVLYDIEAGSLASYGCAWRTMELHRSISDGVVTEDFNSLTHNLNYAPFEYGVYKLTADVTTPAAEDPYGIIPAVHPNGYLTLEKKITADRISGEQIGIADYLAAQMYNMASSLEHGLPGEYVGDKIYDLLGGLTEKLSSMTYLQGLVAGLVNGLPSVDLCEFSYEGNAYTVSENPTPGYDLADFTQDLAEYLIQYDFSGDKKQGLTLAKAFLVVYGGHLSGAHTDVMDEEIAPLIEFLKSGKFVRGLVNLLEDALLPQLEILLDTPIRFDPETPALTGAGFDVTETVASGSASHIADSVVIMLIDEDILFKNTLNGYSSLRLLLADVNDVLTDVLVTPSNEIQNTAIRTVAGVLRGVIGNLPIGKYVDMAQDYLGRVVGCEELRSIVDGELVNKYVTDAFCKNLGIYGANILLDMNIDPTDDGSAWIEGGDRYTRYPVRNYNHVLKVKNEDGTFAFDGHTYQSNVRLSVTPSAENGLLPNMITVSFNNDIYTEKNLSWFTAEQVNVFDKDGNGNWCYSLPDSYIRYSTSEDMSDAVTVKATGENVDRVLPTIDLGIIYINMNHAHKNYNRYTVKLTGLTKGTTYYYQLGKDGAWTKTFTFATAGDGEFTFMAITDIQGSVEENYLASDVYMKKALEFFGKNPAFIVSGGDNVDNGRNILQYTWLLNDQQEIWANNTFVSAAGNHEKHDHALDSIIALPETAAVTNDTGYYYSYDYNCAHFIVLNTNDLDEDNCLSYEQKVWLIEDLEADLENKDTVWTIVVLHKGPYTAGSHAFDDDVTALRAELTPLFDEYGVDLVLQGHDHTYSVSDFLDGKGKKVASVSNGTFYEPKGVLYVNLGTMGDKFYDYIYNENVDLADRRSVSQKLSAYFTEDKNLELTETPVFAKITVNKDDLIIKTYTFIDDEIVPVDEIVLTHKEKKDTGLSLGAKIGIAAGSVAGAALIVAVIIIIIKKKRG